jgi:hypothetical protein
MLFRCSFLGKRPGQHEFGLEYGACGLDHAVERGRHPPDDGMLHAALDVRHDLAGVALEPMPIEIFGDPLELEDQIAGEVLRLNFTPFFEPKTPECGLVGSKDNSGNRTADESASAGKTVWELLPG